MSVERQDGVIILNCDSPGCRANYEGEHGDEFRDAWKEAKRAGWVNALIGEEWQHYCPRCGKSL